MGGMNHQPCRNFLKPSTMLSKHVSMANLQLLQANVFLEDILLAEMDNGKKSLAPVIFTLKQSAKSLGDASMTLVSLKELMDERNYQDLPSLHTLNLKELGVELADQGAVNLIAWNKMRILMRDGTFYTNVAHFSGMFQRLTSETVALTEKFVALEQRAEAGLLTSVLEENQEGNIKFAFAKLLTSWTSFMQEFLASSLVSTEVWYANCGFGSILDDITEKETSIAA